MITLGETRVVRKLLSAAGSFYVPSGYALENVYFVNETANAVTGGLKFGTTLAAADVIAAQAVAASAVGFVPAASFLKRLFARRVNALDAQQTIFVDAVTAWNSASVHLRIVLRKVF